MSDDNRIYDIAISFLQGIGDINAKKLLQKFGSTRKIFSSSLSDLKKTPGFGDYTALKLFNSFPTALSMAEEELLYLYSNDINYVTYTDTEYPQRLKECDDAPMVIYYKGNPCFNDKKIISVVGTRNATKYGLDFCSKLLNELSFKYPDLVIVSGLAFGIDIAAHKESLKNQLKTWAVLGHGLDIIYPAKHKKIADQIIDSNGAILSDYPHASKIDPSNFVKRNRIVAGLCDALIVIESGIRGGSVITANIANHYNRDVFAVPGNVNSISSSGCNKLIKTNRAHLIESAEDIEYIMNWETKLKPTENNLIKIIDNLNENEKIIVNVLKRYDFLDIDNITRQTKLNPNILSLSLLELEFKNIVKALPGKIFTIKIK